MVSDDILECCSNRLYNWITIHTHTPYRLYTMDATLHESIEKMSIDTTIDIDDTGFLRLTSPQEPWLAEINTIASNLYDQIEQIPNNDYLLGEVSQLMGAIRRFSNSYAQKIDQLNGDAPLSHPELDAVCCVCQRLGTQYFDLYPKQTLNRKFTAMAHDHCVAKNELGPEPYIYRIMRRRI